MGQIYQFEKEKMIVGVIYHDKDIYNKAIEMLTDRFGPIEKESQRFSFSERYSDLIKK